MKRLARIFGRDPALQGEAVRHDDVLRTRGRSPDRTAAVPWAIRSLLLDDVQAGDLFGDGVLDLDARIDLDEVKLARRRRRAGTRRCRHCRCARPGRWRGRRRAALANRRIEIRRRGDLDDLLMPALHGAIALVKMDEVAVLIAQKLHLDMPGVDDELFEEDVGIAERGPGLAASLVDGVVEMLGR